MKFLSYFLFSILSLSAFAETTALDYGKSETLIRVKGYHNACIRDFKGLKDQLIVAKKIILREEICDPDSGSELETGYIVILKE